VFSLRSTGMSADKAALVNILEDTLEEIKPIEQSNESNDVVFELAFRGYEIKTLKLSVGAAKSADSSLLSGWVKITS
jgi:hypothetical protein